MEGEFLIVAIVVAVALLFDFTNGFHDTANVVATSISTRAMAPRIAVGYAAMLNFVGAFISLQVAATVANDVVDPDRSRLLAIFAGLVGAIAWNLTTWYFGLPSSSSHALIGGIVGAVPSPKGADADFFERGHPREGDDPRRWSRRCSRSWSAALGSWCSTGSSAGCARAVTGGFRAGQVISGGLLALAHGTNDAQKTMGVITLALVANGASAEDFHAPTWVVVAAATAIALGTYVGGWRIIKTMGSRIHKMDTAQGFAAQGAGAR